MGGGAKILKGSDIARIFTPGGDIPRHIADRPPFERGANLLGGGGAKVL